jgi:hypothetical protein
MGHPAVRDGVAPASCRHVCCAKTAGEDVRRKAGETPALPRAKHGAHALFVFLMEHGRSFAHEIDTVVESHPNLATNARLGWGTQSLYSGQRRTGGDARRSIIYPLPLVKASVSRVFCSTSWAPAEPVDGLGLAERFTDSTARSSAMWRSRGIM